MIIIDDGSTDNTSDVVADFGDERIRYLRLEHTGIIGKVRNYGMAASKGNWISFLDSDDQWKPNKLSVQIDLLRQHPQADLIISNAEEFGIAPECREYDHMFIGDLFHSILIHSKFCLYPTTFMFRKDLLMEEQPFDETVRAASDSPFFFRISRSRTGIFTNEKLVRRRKHDSNVSLTNGTLSYEITLRMLADFRVNQTLTGDMYKTLASKAHYSIGLHHARGGEATEARKHFFKSLLLSPLNLKALLRTLISW